MKKGTRRIRLTQGKFGNERYAIIYALTEPDTGEVRYVGKAEDLEVRYKRHLYPQELNANTHKARWIRKLLSDGKYPGMLVLERVALADWQESERCWISKLKGEGAALTNLCSGGFGRTKGLKHTPEAVAKIVKHLTGHCVSPETREKLRRRFKGVALDEDHCKKLSEAGKRKWNRMHQSDKEKQMQHLLRRKKTDAERKRIGDFHRGKKPNRPTSSRFVGVVRFKRDNNWRAYLHINGRQKHLGYFETQEDAAAAYAEAAEILFGEFACNQ